MLALVMLALASCAGPDFASDADALSVSGSSANVARNSESSWDSAIHGAIPSNIIVDADGLTQQTGGPHRSMSLSYGEITLALTDPLDGSLEGLSILIPDGTEINLDRFISAASTTIAAYDQQVLASLEVQGKITSEQAAVAREAIAAGATIGEALVAAFSPVP